MSDTPLTAETNLTGADRHPLHSDTELVQRWLRSQKPAKRGGTYLASKVQRTFSIGRTSAWEICRRHGFAPDLMVLRS